ncbi:hypothetical protein ACC783_06015 [Rhizobium ruizarguesonis]
MTISRRNLVVRGAIALCAPPFLLRSTSASADDSWATSLSESLVAYENDASKLALPPTDRTRAGSVAQLSEENAYIEGMPRLVDLIERASSSPEASALADKAAILLSDLNNREHMIPRRFAQTNRGPKPPLTSIRGDYLRLFRGCRTRPEFAGTVNWYIQTISRYSPQYKEVSSVTSIPWYFIAIVHALEASFNFRAHLHNGDPLSQRTVHVPKNKPDQWLPPSDWKSSAVDALTQQGFTGKSDWGLERMLYRWEAFNGFGYRTKGVNSPYLWSFSSNYTSGKYKSDGNYDDKVVSKQCGAAVMLKGLVNAGLVTL